MKRNGCHVCSDGISRWFKEGKLHREDGPAVILVGGAQRWYKEGKEYLPSAHETIIYKMNEKHHSIL